MTALDSRDLQATVDSIRRTAEAAIRAAADSAQRVTAVRAHALYDSALTHNAGSASTWLTAMALFVTALGVLFAVGAIVAGILIYRQGSDYKKAINDVISRLEQQFTETMRKHDEAVQVFIQQKNAELDASRVAVAAQIKNLTEEAATAGADAKKRLDAEIERAKSSLAALRPLPVWPVSGGALGGATLFPPISAFVPATSDPDRALPATTFVLGGTIRSAFILSSGEKKCPHCGKRVTFQFENLDSQPYLKCPHCQQDFKAAETDNWKA